MNTKKRVFAALLCTLPFQIGAFADNDKPITFEQLPAPAQQTIKSHFANGNIALVTVERELLDKTYDVVFTDGTKLEFDSKGEWLEINQKQNNVPTALVPQKIADYVKAKYADQGIRKIEKDRKEYEATLANGVEITFNKEFMVVDID